VAQETSSHRSAALIRLVVITEREFLEIIGLSLALVSGLGIGFRQKRRACHLRV